MRTRLFVPLVAVALLSGCTDDGDAGQSTTPAAPDHGEGDGDESTISLPPDHVITVFPVGDGGDDALFTGVIGVDDGCAVIDNGDAVGVVYWGFGTRLEGTSEVRFPDGYTIDVTDGSPDELGGGWGGASRGRRLADPELDECLDRTGAEFVLFANP